MGRQDCPWADTVGMAAEAPAGATVAGVRVPQEKPRQQVRPKEAWPGLSVAEERLVGGTG